MPRQPLLDTPGLPPYGQRSSERRKEQNRLAQRQLRERRQQQEAAQALKLQQQQNEIRRLNRLITELRNENFNLKNQSAFRRRQSVIPISSLSRGLMPTSMSGGTGVESSSKPFARHSIDYSSLHGACISTSSDASQSLHDQIAFQEAYSEDEYAMNYISSFRESTAKSTILQPTRLSYDNPFCRRTLAPQPCIFQDGSIKVNRDKVKAPSNKRYIGETSSPMASSLPSTKPMANPTWLSASRNTTPTAAEVSENPCVASPQKLENSPQRDSTSKGEITLPSVNLASFWPARPPSPSNDLRSCADVDRLSDSPSNHSVVPTELFSAFNPLFSNNRIQTRKTSASADSDSSSSTANSILPTCDSNSPLSTMNANVQFSLASQEALSHYLTRSLSPTATGSSPEVKNEEKYFSKINSAICFRSPFSEINHLEMNEDSTFSLPFSWNENKKFNVETLSPFPTHANSMCSIDVNDFWASDY